MSYEGDIKPLSEIILEKLAYNSRLFVKTPKSIVLFLRNTQTILDDKHSTNTKQIFKFLTLDKNKQPITIGHIVIQI